MILKNLSFGTENRFFYSLHKSLCINRLLMLCSEFDNQNLSKRQFLAFKKHGFYVLKQGALASKSHGIRL